MTITVLAVSLDAPSGDITVELGSTFNITLRTTQLGSGGPDDVSVRPQWNNASTWTNLPSDFSTPISSNPIARVWSPSPPSSNNTHTFTATANQVGTFEIRGFAQCVITSDRISIESPEITVIVSPKPGKGALALTGKVPSVFQALKEIPGKGALTLTGKTPTLFRQDLRKPAKEALSLSGKVPILRFAYKELPNHETLALSGKQPSTIVNHIARPGAGSLSFTGKSPIRLVMMFEISGKGALALSGKVPLAPVTAHQVVLPGRRILTLAPEAPISISTTDNYSGPGKLAMNFAGKVPTLNQTTHRTIPIPAATLALTGSAPASVKSQVRPVGVVSLSLTGKTPSRVPSTWIPVPVGAVGLTTYGNFLVSDVLALTIATYAPIVTVNDIALPAAGALTFEGKDVLANNAATQSPAVELVLTTYAPTISFSSFFERGPTRLVSLTVDRRLEVIGTPTQTLID